jgi:hypothetical protein
MVSGSGRYAEYGAVAGAHRPQTSDLSSKKMSPDGFSTCKQYYAPLSNKNLSKKQMVSPSVIVVTVVAVWRPLAPASSVLAQAGVGDNRSEGVGLR